MLAERGARVDFVNVGRAPAAALDDNLLNGGGAALVAQVVSPLISWPPAAGRRLTNSAQADAVRGESLLKACLHLLKAMGRQHMQLAATQFTDCANSAG